MASGSYSTQKPSGIPKAYVHEGECGGNSYFWCPWDDCGRYGIAPYPADLIDPRRERCLYCCRPVFFAYENRRKQEYSQIIRAKRTISEPNAQIPTKE